MNGQDGSEKSVEEAEAALHHAEESGNRLQILRARLSLGIALLNAGRIGEAERHFGEVILETKDESEDPDILQVFGQTLLVRANILMGKSLYNQALELGLQALGVLSDASGYVDLRNACSLLSRTYRAMGDSKQADEYERRSQEYSRLIETHGL
ncbi:MAG: hypothetical protein ACP6KW_10155 [Candidatus Thorarchaeota archaeon]